MIVNNIAILQVVSDIETEYNKSIATHYAILYSKLAIIEFCGWVEQTFDSILQNYCFSKLADINSELYTFTKKLLMTTMALITKKI